MKNYGLVYGEIAPEEVEITESKVFIAENITPYSEVIDEKEISGFMYNYIEYTKDEYIQLLTQKNEEVQTSLLDTQMALCDIYEMLEGV